MIETIERPGESRMGQHVLTHVPSTNLNTLLHSLRPSTPAFMPSAVLLQQKRFPDVSFWQGEIDWDMMLSMTDTIIIRAGQGSWPDIQFKRNYAEAKKRGIRRGIYWFYDDRHDPRKQAELLISLIDGDLPEMKIYVDWETKFGGSFGGLRNVVAFMQLVEATLGVELGIYTGYWFARENSNPILNAGQFTYLKVRELWLAFYAEARYVLVPLPWSELTHWQDGTPPDGLAHGVKSKELDRNWANMTAPDFDRRYPMTGAPVPPIVVVPPVVIVTPPARPVILPYADNWKASVRLFNRMTIRTYPLVADDTKTPEYVLAGETFTGKIWSGNGYVWMQIAMSPRAALIGKWVAVRTLDGVKKFISLVAVGTALPSSGILLPSGNFMRILHDQQAKDGLQRVGYPEVIPLTMAKYCDLTEEAQWYWFRVGLVHPFTGYTHWDEKKLSHADLKMLKGKWTSLTKTKEAFTNKKGTDICADHINGNGLSEMPGQEPLACCGNIVKVLGPTTRIAGKTVYPIETLDGNRPPPPLEKINRLLAPHILQCADVVASVRDHNKNKVVIVLPDGRFRVDPFPQLAPRDTLFALRSNGKETDTYERDGVWYAINFILASRLAPVDGLFTPPVYVP